MDIQIPDNIPEKDTTLYKRVRRRTRTTNIALIGVMMLVAMVIVSKQYTPLAAKLRAAASGTRNFKPYIEPAKRGDIYSYDKKLLATTQTQYDIYMDFEAGGMTDSMFNADINGLSKGLSSMFGDKSAQQYKNLLKNYKKQKKRYQKITPRKINQIELEKLRTLPLWRYSQHKSGKIEVRSYRRDTPYETLAKRTIGRPANPKNEVKGVGIEAAFDKYLAGVDGVGSQRKISGTFWVPIDTEHSTKPIDGMDVVTTIDIELQDAAETALKESLEKHKANWGTAIVMDVETGEIKVMANIARSASGNFSEEYNYALGMAMEPGSTFKLATLIALIEDAGASLDDIVDCGDGVVRVGPRSYTDTKAGGYGKIPLIDVFSHSSNIGFAVETNKYYGKNPQGFIDAINDIGFLDSLNLQIPGETKPTLRNPEDRYWDGTTLGMTSTGYSGIMLSPLRTLMLFNAVANNGKMIEPIFVKQIEKDGDVVESYESRVINSQICSKTTIKGIQKSLEKVVSDGTGALFLYNDYYKIAGKTGTAQIFRDGTYKGKNGIYYLGTFAGYFPADNPKYSCVVAVETFKPHGIDRKYYGGTTAGPVFRAIADRVYTHAVEWGHTIEKPTNEKILKAEAEKAKQGITSEPKPEKIYTKKGGEKRLLEIIKELDIDKNSIVFADGTKIEDIETIDSYKTIPNVKGMGLTDAVELFREMGITVIPKGKGRIIRQSQTPGSKIVKGSTITLTLSL